MNVEEVIMPQEVSEIGANQEVAQLERTTVESIIGQINNIDPTLGKESSIFYEEYRDLKNALDKMQQEEVDPNNLPKDLLKDVNIEGNDNEIDLPKNENVIVEGSDVFMRCVGNKKGVGFDQSEDTPLDKVVNTFEEDGNTFSFMVEGSISSFEPLDSIE